MEKRLQRLWNTKVLVRMLQRFFAIGRHACMPANRASNATIALKPAFVCAGISSNLFLNIAHDRRHYAQLEPDGVVYIPIVGNPTAVLFPRDRCQFISKAPIFFAIFITELQFAIRVK
jgi:hypothetical protein